MKRILITGANSYIGTSFEKHIAQWPEAYAVETIDMIGNRWREKNFTGYDAVFHVAGIAHADIGRVDHETEELYHQVNTALTIETAKKAKDEGIKQFIFMSSIIVYGDSAPVGRRKMITSTTLPKPTNFYGESKLLAEQGIETLSDTTFKVCILRPPMIYGKGSKGNYTVLSKFAQMLPFFPDVENQRSMLYIENLSEYVRLIIENNEEGVFFPQNQEYVRTSDMVKLIAAVHGKKIRMTRAFNWLLPMAAKCTGLVDKAFGNLTYDISMSQYKRNYCLCNLVESIRRTEVG